MSAYDYNDGQNVSDAEKRLATLLPNARARAAEVARSGGDVSVKFGIPASKSAFASLREKNLKGVHIYRASLGGWAADVELTNVPRDTPHILKTPLAQTHENAITAAMDILIAILVQESAYQGEHRWFNFYGMNIGLPVDRLEKAKPILRKRGDRMDLPYIHGMMRETMELFFDTPDNVSYASLDLLTEEEQKSFFTCIAVAICAGLSFYPPGDDGSPPAPVEEPRQIH